MANYLRWNLNRARSKRTEDARITFDYLICRANLRIALIGHEWSIRCAMHDVNACLAIKEIVINQSLTLFVHRVAHVRCQ